MADTPKSPWSGFLNNDSGGMVSQQAAAMSAAQELKAAAQDLGPKYPPTQQLTEIQPQPFGALQKQSERD